MADAVNIAEYLAVLGYRVDEQSQRKFMDAVESMSKAVLGLSAGLVAAAGGVTAAVAQMAGSSEKMYYLAQRIGDSVSDVDALTFAFSKLGLAPEQTISAVTHMADEMRNNPSIRGIWQNITGSDHITAASLQKYSDFYRGLTTETQRAYRQMLGFGEEMHLAFLRGGPGGGVGEFNFVNQLFHFDPNAFAEQSAKTQNAWRSFADRLNAIWGEVSTPIARAMEQTYNGLTAFLDSHAGQINAIIDKVFIEVTKVKDGALDMAHDIMGWFNSLTASQTAVAEAIIVIGAAFMKPGWLMIGAIAYSLELLLKDYEAFKRTGSSPLDIPWESIGKGIDGITQQLGKLNDAMGGFVTPWHALEAFIGIKLLATAINFFTAVAAGAATAGAAVTTSLGGAFGGIWTILSKLGPLLLLLGLGQVGGELTPAEQNKIEQEHGYRRKQGVPLFDQFGQPIPGTAPPPSGTPAPPTAGSPAASPSTSPSDRTGGPGAAAQFNRSPAAPSQGSPIGATTPSASSPSDQSGPGLITKMWRGFWDSIVGTAHAEELPDNVKVLTRQLSDLNDTLTDMLSEALVPGSTTGGRPVASGGSGIGPGNINVPIADYTKDAIQSAFLRVLSGPESGGAYDIKNGGSKFSGFDQFPEGVGAGGTSSASGRYQFVSGTWKRVQELFGVSDFSPENQDKGAWSWAARVYRLATMRDLEGDLKAGGHEGDIVGALRSQWPSLTEQHLKAMNTSLLRNPNQVTNNTSSGHSVEQHNNVTIHAPSGDADDIMRAMDQANNRHYADIQRHLSNPLQ